MALAMRSMSPPELMHDSPTPADLPSDWERRKAEPVRKNVAAVKAHNERQKIFERDLVAPDEPIPCACECGDANCYDPIGLTIAQLDGGHVGDRWYIVKPRHVMPDYEFVIAQHETHWVVEKYAPDKTSEAGAMQQILNRLRRSRKQNQRAKLPGGLPGGGSPPLVPETD